MDSESYYRYMDQLRFSKTAEERREALNMLKMLEVEGVVDPQELLQLLEEEDPVLKAYAIGAVARLKVAAAEPRLKQMFSKSGDPLILVILIESFIEFSHAGFVAITVRKLKRLNNIFLRFLHARRKNVLFDDAFVLNQILVSALKYFEFNGSEEMKSFLTRFLKHSDSNVRWHTLKVFQNVDIQIPAGRLKKIIENDSYAPNRELAAIILSAKN